MKASAEKKANVSTPRVSTAAGRPRAARSVPGGVRARKAGTTRTAPSATIPPRSHGDPAVRPASTRPAPTARRRARPTGADPWSSGSGVPTPRSARTARSTTAPVMGTRPRNTHRHPTVVATADAASGEISDGTIHDVDMTANTWGRSGAGKPRPTHT